MKKLLALFIVLISTFELTGCSVMSAVATSNRMEEARAANAGKEL